MSEDRLARLLLRGEIEELVVENAYLLDRGRFEEIVELYTEDCEVTRPLPPFTSPSCETIRGRSALRAWYADPTAWPPTPRTMRHVMSNLRLASVSQDRVEGLSTWTGYRYEGVGRSIAHPMAVGDYEDEYRRAAGGRWRIHRRKIIIAFLNQQLLESAVSAAKNG